MHYIVPKEPPRTAIRFPLEQSSRDRESMRASNASFFGLEKNILENSCSFSWALVNGSDGSQDARSLGLAGSQTAFSVNFSSHESQEKWQSMNRKIGL